jgi:hypothetical protein
MDPARNGLVEPPLRCQYPHVCVCVGSTLYYVCAMPTVWDLTRQTIPLQNVQVEPKPQLNQSVMCMLYIRTDG